MESRLSLELLEALGRMDTCTVSNAIETFNVRLRNEGFANASIRGFFTREGVSLVGYAATGRIRSSLPPPAGHTYWDRTDWWNYILSVPAPRVVVLEDVDAEPGLGSLIGEVHANILRALGCTGAVTNGAVRDLEGVAKTGFQVFAGNVAVSHAYVHIVDFGDPVEIGGLRVHPGDLIHGDCHGVLSIPKHIAARLPEAVHRIAHKERKVIEFCQSPGFSVEKLREVIKELG